MDPRGGARWIVYYCSCKVEGERMYDARWVEHSRWYLPCPNCKAQARVLVRSQVYASRVRVYYFQNPAPPPNVMPKCEATRPRIISVLTTLDTNIEKCVMILNLLDLREIGVQKLILWHFVDFLEWVIIADTNVHRVQTCVTRRVGSKCLYPRSQQTKYLHQFVNPDGERWASNMTCFCFHHSILCNSRIGLFSIDWWVNNFSKFSSVYHQSAFITYPTVGDCSSNLEPFDHSNMVYGSSSQLSSWMLLVSVFLHLFYLFLWYGWITPLSINLVLSWRLSSKRCFTASVIINGLIISLSTKQY